MTTVFIANRGEIAARIIRTAHDLGYRVVVAYPEIDASLPYVLTADEAILLDSPRDFANVETMVDIAAGAGATFVHPGYGFLSENPEFARSVASAGMTFVGPSAGVIEQMGDKARARELAARTGVPVTPGSEGAIETFEQLEQLAGTIEFPIMIKAVAGGGGIGMAIVHGESELKAAFEQVSGRATSVFGDSRLIVERYIARSRHIEVQIMGLPNGEIVTFAERDCSVQRRHQKVVEETPSPALNSREREEIAAAASALARAVGYVNAGTVEFIYDLDQGKFYFLEMNTRLQVEHPVTEAVHNVDLVAWQFSVAQELNQIPDDFSSTAQGHAIELRLYAEDSERFLPRPGQILTWQMPEGPGIRVDAGYANGTEVTPFFDPLIAKIVAHGSDRSEAIDRAAQAARDIQIEGPGVNAGFLRKVLDSEAFRGGDYSTGLVVS